MTYETVSFQVRVFGVPVYERGQRFIDTDYDRKAVGGEKEGSGEPKVEDAEELS